MKIFDKPLLAAGTLALMVLRVPAAVACSSSGGATPMVSTGVSAAEPALPAEVTKPAKTANARAATSTPVAKTRTVLQTHTAIKMTTVTPAPRTVRVTSAPKTVTVTETVVAPARTVFETLVETVTQTKTETETVAAEQAVAPQGLVDTGSVYFKNCSAARAAGAAPVLAGDPGYRSGLDRDGDGIACE